MQDSQNKQLFENHDDPDGSERWDDTDDTSELDEIDPDDHRWNAFIPDDDECDPQPEYGDFWVYDGN